MNDIIQGVAFVYMSGFLIIFLSLILQKRILALVQSKHKDFWRKHGSPSMKLIHDKNRRILLWNLMALLIFLPHEVPNDKLLKRYLLWYRLLFIPTLALPTIFFVHFL